ncbi:MAG TPA: response regulator [Allocoleopsis sp.]
MNSDTAAINILIVDDYPNNLQVLSTLLSQEGYRVRKATSGTFALKAIQAELPDLILLDIQMPQMDGYEVCSRLKADPATANIPIIFLSAMDALHDKVRAFTIGGSDYVTKPFQGLEVLARVKHHLTIQQQRQKLLQLEQELKQTQQMLAQQMLLQ